MLARVVSGGQTGVDQAALRAARAAGVATGGKTVLGFLTEDGPNPSLAEYGLEEINSTYYPERARLNVEESHATLWLGDPATPGGRCTLRYAEEAGRPLFVVRPGAQVWEAAGWLLRKVFPAVDGGVILNVAGNRERFCPGIGARAERFLTALFKVLAPRPGPD